MSNPIHSQHSDAYIKFFPFIGEDTRTISGSAMEVSAVTAKDDIISIQTSKNKSGVGQWSCVLASTVDYHSRIFPGCWCLIYMAANQLEATAGAGPNSGLKMIGIVKSVRKIESTDANTGIRTVQHIISGQDVSAVLNMPIYVNSNLAGLDQSAEAAFRVVSLVYGNKDFSLQKPAGLAQKLLTLVYGAGPNDAYTGAANANPKLGYQFSVPAKMQKDLYGKAPSSIRFLKFLKTSLQDNLSGKAEVQPDIGGTITAWSLLKTYCNPLMNELYCDLIPDDEGNLRPTLVLRAIPFSSKSGKPYAPCLAMNSGVSTTPTANGLYVSKEIQEHQIMQLNYGKSESDRFNFFLAVPNNVSAVGSTEASNITNMILNSGGLASLGDPKSIERYGIRPFVASSIWLLLDKDSFLNFNATVRDLWNRAHLFDNGIITLVGSNEHIPVGSNIKFSQRNWLAHVETVTHNYGVDAETGKKRYTTDIAFVRLQDPVSGNPLFLSRQDAQIEPYDRGFTNSHNAGATWTSGVIPKDGK